MNLSANDEYSSTSTSLFRLFSSPQFSIVLSGVITLNGLILLPLNSMLNSVLSLMSIFCGLSNPLYCMASHRGRNPSLSDPGCFNFILLQQRILLPAILNKKMSASGDEVMNGDCPLMFIPANGV